MKLLVAAMLLLFSSLAFGEELDLRGEVSSDLRRSVSHLFKQLVSKGLPLKRVADSLSTKLQRAAYYDSRFSIDGDTLRFDIGEQLLIAEFRVLSDSLELSNPNILFTEESVGMLIEERLRLARSNGRYYARAIIKSVSRINNDGVRLDLELNSGPVLRLSEQKLSGLVHTRKDLVRSYLPGKRGNYITDDFISRTDQAAREIPFLQYIPPLSVQPSPGFTEAALHLKFLEKKQVRITGGGGVTSDDNRTIVWNLDLRLLNLFGGGRSIKFASDQRESGRSLLNIGYNQPIFVFGRGEFGARLSTRNYPDLFYEFGAGAGISSGSRYSLRWGSGLDWKRVEPSDARPSYSRYGLSVHIERGTYSELFNPSSGYEFSWNIKYVHRRYDRDSLELSPERSVLNETRIDLSFSALIGLPAQSSLLLATRYHGLETEESLPPESEMYFFGGLPDLRGFRDDQFIAQRAALITVEPRYRFTGSYMFFFYDAVFLNRNVGSLSNGVRTEESFENSYGFGLALGDESKYLELSFGWNPEVSISEPRLSVSLSRDL